VARAVDWVHGNRQKFVGRCSLPSIVTDDEYTVEEIAKKMKKDEIYWSDNEKDEIRLHTSFQVASRQDMTLMINAMEDENVRLNIVMQVIFTRS